MPELFSENPFVVYRSSAGSGKTYTLAREYLRLALRNERKGAYKRILAVTFTNKAMQEMKDRIIRYLDEFAQGEKNEMATELQHELRLSPKEFKERCKKVLSSILHGYGNFAVTTIDAFFQQVLRSFARELQVGGNYHLELDQALVYEKVVDALMADLDNTPTTERWVTDFGMSKLDEGKGWEVDRQLVVVGANGHRSAAEDVGGSHQHGVAHLVGEATGPLEIRQLGPLGLIDLQLVEQAAEAVPILRGVAVLFSTLGLRRIFGNCSTENTASKRVMEKNGMILEGTTKDSFIKWGVWEDEHHFGLTRPVYEQRRATLEAGGG